MYGALRQDVDLDTFDLISASATMAVSTLHTTAQLLLKSYLLLPDEAHKSVFLRILQIIKILVHIASKQGASGKACRLQRAFPTVAGKEMQGYLSRRHEQIVRCAPSIFLYSNEAGVWLGSRDSGPPHTRSRHHHFC
jgi:hypothetical protein